MFICFLRVRYKIVHVTIMASFSETELYVTEQSTISQGSSDDFFFLSFFLFFFFLRSTEHRLHWKWKVVFIIRARSVTARSRDEVKTESVSDRVHWDFTPLSLPSPPFNLYFSYVAKALEESCICNARDQLISSYVFNLLLDAGEDFYYRDT